MCVYPEELFYSAKYILKTAYSLTATLRQKYSETLNVDHYCEWLFFYGFRALAEYADF